MLPDGDLGIDDYYFCEGWRKSAKIEKVLVKNEQPTNVASYRRRRDRARRNSSPRAVESLFHEVVERSVPTASSRGTDEIEAVMLNGAGSSKRKPGPRMRQPYCSRTLGDWRSGCRENCDAYHRPPVCGALVTIDSAPVTMSPSNSLAC